MTSGCTLQIACVSANLLFKKSLAEAKSMLFHLCTTLISSSWVCISSGHPGGYLWLHCLWTEVGNMTVDLTPHSVVVITVCSSRWLLLCVPTSGTSSCDRMGTGAQIRHQHWGALPPQHSGSVLCAFHLPTWKKGSKLFLFCEAAWTLKLQNCIKLFLWAGSDHGCPE